MLPIASVLAVAGLGQMLVIQQGGIDLSVAGAISMTVVMVTHIPDGDNAKLVPAILRRGRLRARGGPAQRPARSACCG